MNKALFLDRDGVINIDRGYVYRIADFTFQNGIFELARLAREKGYLIIVATNQSGIERGYYTEADYETVTQYMTVGFMRNGIEIDACFHCPYLHHEDRKPNPGMFRKAEKQFGIDMSASLAVGDKERDSLAALAAGVRNTFLLGSAPCGENTVIHRIRTLGEIVPWL